MTVSIHGYPKFKFFLPGTNQLAVGAQLFTYEPGTSTKKTTHQDFDQLSANTNPIILDSNGEATVFLDGKYKLVLAPATDTDPPASPYWTLDEVGDADNDPADVGITNKIKNGSFEVDTDGDGVPDNWTLTAGAGNTLAVDTSDQYHGDTSIKFTIASANTAVASTDFFEVQEGQVEVLRWAMKASAADIDVIMRLKWYTSAQVFIENSDVYTDSATNPTSWTDKGVLFTPSPTARFAKLEIRVATTGKTVNIDNIRTLAFEHHDTDQTVTGQWTFSDQTSVIGGVTASNLVDKSATETVSGAWTFSNNSSVIGGVTASNLVDKSATETISGAWTFSNNSSVIGGVTASNLVDKSTTETISGAWTYSGLASFNNGTTKFGSTAPGESWNSSAEALELGSTSSVWGGTGGTAIGQNSYNDDIGWKYQTAAAASAIYQAAGTIYLKTATSGSADAAITFKNVITCNTDGTADFVDNLGMTAGKGIDFSANTHTSATGASMTSELLDWYEEGTWTPTLQDGSFSDSESQAYTTQVGVYTRVGNRVFFNGRLQTSSLGGLTSSLFIANLPFTSDSTTNNMGTVNIGYANNLTLTASGESITGTVNTGTSRIALYVWDSTGATTTLRTTDVSATFDIVFSGHYMV